MMYDLDPFFVVSFELSFYYKNIRICYFEGVKVHLMEMKNCPPYHAMSDSCLMMFSGFLFICLLAKAVFHYKQVINGIFVFLVRCFVC